MRVEDMSSVAITTLLEARAIANEWLITHLPDRFAAGVPAYDQELPGWRIPVWLSYPGLEPLGPVGHLILDEGGTINADTAVSEMKRRALKLYKQNRERIEAGF
jgi:hypothetical protein